MIFSRPVSHYMTADVATVGPEVMLPAVAHKLAQLRVSALAVVDTKGTPIGVVSRTDLVRVGRTQAGSHRKASALTLPEQQVSELLRELGRAPLLTTPKTSLRDAARVMCEQRVHRLFVVERDVVVGVLSTLDLMAAVVDAKVDRPLTDIMSAPLLSVTAQQPISVAIERLEKAHVSGLVVLDDEWPVGVFTQVEAMESRDLPRDTRIDDAFDPSMLCLLTTTKAHRAAAQAQRLAVRRVIVCRDREAVGIITGFDFAKLVAA